MWMAFFSLDQTQKRINKIINQLGTGGYQLTCKTQEWTPVFLFLGVQVNHGVDPMGKSILWFTQDGLIDKVLEAVGLTDCNIKCTPARITPLGSNTLRLPQKKTWSYASVVGILMFLGSNAFPEIQIAVHQCARFTHRPQKVHEEAIKHICWYLKGAKGRGLTFAPTNSLNPDCYVDANFSELYGYEDL